MGLVGYGSGRQEYYNIVVNVTIEGRPLRLVKEHDPSLRTTESGPPPPPEGLTTEIVYLPGRPETARFRGDVEHRIRSGTRGNFSMPWAFGLGFVGLGLFVAVSVLVAGRS